MFIKFTDFKSNRSKFAIFTMIIIFLLAIFLVCYESVTPNSITEFPLGKLEGHTLHVLGNSVYSYLNIPYAEAPINDLRFKPPVLLSQKWNNVRNAKNYSPGCPQHEKHVKMQNIINTGNIKYDEDCLYLNIWTLFHQDNGQKANKNDLKPVVVFLHGGAFSYNSASEEKYFDGKFLSRLANVVVVTINYRLGILGFLYNENESLGNLGLHDQKTALQWVKNYIEYFGGNPDEITIIGESSGSWSVGLHLLNDDSNLFQKAIMMSGTPIMPILGEDESIALNKFDLVKKKMDCNDFSCLQKKSLQDLLNLQFDEEIINLNKNSYRLAFQPVFGSKNKLIKDSSLKLLQDKNYLAFNKSLMIGNLVNHGQDLFNFWKKSFDSFDESKLKKKPDYLDLINKFLTTTTNKKEDEVKEFTKLVDKFYFMQNDNLEFDISDDDFEDEFETSLKNSFFQFLSDFVYLCPTKKFTELYFQKYKSENVFEYQILYESSSLGSKIFAPWCDQEKYGPCQTVDLQYLFGRPFKYPMKYNQFDRTLSFDFIKSVSIFAHTGKANWKSYFEISYDSKDFTIPVNLNFHPENGNDDLIGYQYSSCKFLDFLYQ